VFVKNPFLITSLIWIVSLVYWGAINIYYMTEDYQFAQCYIPFVPAYTQFLYFFFGVFIPLVIIIVLSIYVAVVIGKKQRVKRLKNKKNKAPHTTTTTATGEATTSNKVNKKAKKEFRLSPEVRLSLIVLVYIIQYTPSCFLDLINSLCNCIPTDLSTALYWLTYTTQHRSLIQS
jgi:hypothetical protein